MALKTLIPILLVFSDGLRTCCAVRYRYLKLELVQVLFRHGERTPQRDEINLIGNSSIGLEQPWGFAQLTNERRYLAVSSQCPLDAKTDRHRGKRQEYRIGAMLRERYDKFLGAYQPDKVYACSSAFDRTKTSLQLVLAGLYPPSEEFAWNAELSWMPIPIHFVPRELDVLFNLNRCPTFKETWKKLMNSREMKNKLAAYQDIIKLLNKYYPHIKFNFEQLFYMNNVLNIQQKWNVTMPKWYTPQRHEKITRGAKCHLESLSYTQDLIRLNGGGLARRLLENMDVNGRSENPRKIYLYSGHEFTLYALAKAHGVTLTRSPLFGSAIVVEKFRDDQGDLYVKLYYWAGEEDETLTTIVLPNCDEYCRMEDYMNLVKPSLPSDDEMLCLYKNLESTDIEKMLTTDAISVPI